MFSIPQKIPLTTKSDFKTSVSSLQIGSKCFQYLKKDPLRQNPTSKHPLYNFKSGPNVFNTSKKTPYDKIRLQNIRFIASNRVQMFSIPQKRPLTTKSDFKTSASSLQIGSKCFQYLKKDPLRQNPTSKHPLYHFKSSPNAFNTSKKAPYDKIRLQNIRFIISNRVQMLSIPQKKPLTTKSVFKTSALSFQIESKCFQYLKKSPLRQNPSSKHPFHHFKSSPNVFNTSKKAPYRVQMLSIPQKKPLTTKPVFKTSVSSFQIESKCFQYLKKSPLSSPNAFNTSKKAPYDKTRLQNIRFIISNRVQMFSIPQKKPLIESKCFLYLKKSPLRQNPSSKHPFHHFKSSPNVFNTSKKAPYRVQMLFIPQKKPLTTKPVFKTSVSSFQIESKCSQYLKKSPLSSPNAFYTSKKAPYDKTRLQNIRFIISNRVQMLFIPQKKPLTTKPVFKTSVSSFQIE